MGNDKNYATIGMVYDFLVEKHAQTGRNYSFPEAVDGLRTEGKLLKTIPATPPFHSNMAELPYRDPLLAGKNLPKGVRSTAAGI